MLRCNNISTVAHLNNMGGCSTEMNSIWWTIHLLCKVEHIQLTAIYLLGVNNTVADCLSWLHPHHKWHLYLQCLSHLLTVGTTTID
jgi:hypothetical protein